MNTKSILAAQGRLGEKWVATVSATQERAIMRAAGTKHGLTIDDLAAYVTTGDASYLDSDTKSKLDAIRKAAQEGLSPSQAKRIWPRKVASVLLDEIAAR